jgi:hypothetical protein
MLLANQHSLTNNFSIIDLTMHISGIAQWSAIGNHRL